MCVGGYRQDVRCVDKAGGGGQDRNLVPEYGCEAYDLILLVIHSNCWAWIFSCRDLSVPIILNDGCRKSRTGVWSADGFKRAAPLEKFLARAVGCKSCGPDGGATRSTISSYRRCSAVCTLAHFSTETQRQAGTGAHVVVGANDPCSRRSRGSLVSSASSLRSSLHASCLPSSRFSGRTTEAYQSQKTSPQAVAAA